MVKLIGTIAVIFCVTFINSMEIKKRACREKLERIAQEKLHTKRLLQNEIQKMRLIKRELALKRELRRIKLDKKFKEALIKNDIIEVEKLLKLGIDVNRVIEYSAGDTISYEYPIVTAAVAYSNMDMVKLLLQFGASTHFKESSLVNIMLNFFVEENGLCINLLDYFGIILFLLERDGFNKQFNQDLEESIHLWFESLRKIDFDSISLDEEKIFNELSNFFSSYKFLSKHVEY